MPVDNRLFCVGKYNRLQQLTGLYSKGIQVGAIPRTGFHAFHARPFRARSNTMSKTQRTNKESKKKSLLTPKEKKAAKRDKKNPSGHTPFVIKDS